MARDIVNNVESDSVDFDSKPLTVADIQEETRRYLDRLRTNKIAIAGEIRSKRKSEPKPKIDKKTGEHILNEDGSPAFWSPYYYVVLAFQGGEISIQVQDDWFPFLDIGASVLFEGCKGLSFGNVADVYHNYTLL